VDYDILLLDTLAKNKTGQNVSYIVAIINPAVYGEIAFDYQTIGGNFSASSSAIKQLIENLQLDNRSIRFDDLLDLPVTYPPSFHLHRVGDLFGWEDMVDAVLQIKALLQNGNDNLFDAVDTRFNEVVIQINNIWNKLQVDVANKFYELENAVTRIDSEIKSIKLGISANTNLINSLRDGTGYKSMANQDVLLAGGKYTLTTDTEFRLPNSSLKTVFGDQLKIGDSVEFVCRGDVTAIVSVFDPTIDRIRFNGVNDISVRCKHVKKGKAIYIAPSTWEIYV
jgi:hypothetical protein